MTFFSLRAVALACSTGLASMSCAHAYELLNGLGGQSGYGTEFLSPNDDGSIGPLALPFNIDFFGQNFSRFYLNNNGNITFSNALSQFTPRPFPISNQPTLAPYWADVDTRGSGITNKVWYASPNANTLVVTWDNVGYYNRQTDKANSFQLILSKQDDHGGFNAEYRYQTLQWTTGSASGGVAGLGGTPAQAGWDAGDSVNFQTLPGSRTAEVLNLVNTSNVSSATPGLWRFSFLNGALPGRSSLNPLLPNYTGGATDPAWHFQFQVPDTTTRLYIDPLIAVGYEYAINTSGTYFSSVLLPDVGDGIYGLSIWDGAAWVGAGNVSAGNVFTFANGVSRFRVDGVEASAGLDPANPQAFVTGLTFSSAGQVEMSQTPLTVNVAAVPEPEVYALVLAGLVVVGGTRASRRHRGG